MADKRRLTFFHAPNSRSTGVLTLLEELGCDYDLQVLNLKNGEQRKPEYLAINPMGKVPAIRHGDAVVTEQPAVYLYLADLFPEAGLAPAMGDPLRGPYLRWLVFYGSSFEPAVIDRSQQRAPAPMATSPTATTILATPHNSPTARISSASVSRSWTCCGGSARGRRHSSCAALRHSTSSGASGRPASRVRVKRPRRRPAQA
jgi:hypothetical protein